MKTRQEVAALRAAAEQHAIYARELQSAHYRIQRRARWMNTGGALYSMAAFVASIMLWSWLPLDPAWVFWSLTIATWIGLVALWVVAQQKLRLVILQRRTERMSVR